MCSESAQHQVNVAQVDHRRTRLGLPFVVFAMASRAPIPRVGTLHHPTFLEWSKAFGAFWPRFHLDAPRRTMFAHPGVKHMMVILVVGKYRFKPGKSVRLDQLEQLWGCYTIIQPRARDQDDNQQAQGIHHQMSLAPFDLLAAIIAALATSHLRRLDGLAVDTRGTWRGLPTRVPAGLLAQPIQHLGPRAVVAPPGKVVVHGALGQHIMREHLPWTPAP